MKITKLQSSPNDILSLPILITAGVGLGVNSVDVVLLHDSSHHDLNLRGAFLHVIADIITSIKVILAAIAVWLMHWLWADGVISLFGSGIIFLSTMPLIVQRLNILLKDKGAYLHFILYTSSFYRFLSFVMLVASNSL